MLTDQDLRAALHALGAEPPPAPAGRVASSVRRARTIRIRRLAGVAVAVVAVAVPAALVVPGLGGHPTSITSPASWPDRRAAGMDYYTSRAYADWETSNDLAPGERVRWVYADRVPGTPEVAVAFATCTADACSRLVLRGSVRNRPADWTDVTRQLSPYGSLGPPALFFDGPQGGHGPVNVVFVLAPPGTTRVTYRSAANRPGTGGTGDLPSIGHGAFAGAIGYVSGTVTVTAYDRSGKVLDTGLVGAAGAPTSIGNPPVADPVDRVPGYEFVMIGWETPTSSLPPEVTTYAVFYRCISDQPMLGSIREYGEIATCDGKTHRLGPDQRAPNPFVGPYFSSEDPYATVAYAIGVPAS